MPKSTKEAQREYQREWFAKRRAAFFYDKFCELCGSVEKLELDHIDPTTKILEPSRLWSMSDSNPRKIAELAKCRVLCHSCHLVKSQGEANKGKDHGSAKLTDDLVLAIRASYEQDHVTQQQLANVYGINRATVGKIVTRKLWAHI